jgi:hypothetical protein
MHPFHKLGKKKRRTAAENLLLRVLVLLSTREGYSHLTFEEIWDKLQAEK